MEKKLDLTSKQQSVTIPPQYIISRNNLAKNQNIYEVNPTYKSNNIAENPVNILNEIIYRMINNKG